MRKTIKKIATVVASLSMVAAMSVSAFAAKYDTYQFAGNPNLVGEADPGNSSVGWVTVREEQFLQPVSGMTDVYVFTANYVHAADYDTLDDATKAGYREFKILGDGDLEGWNHQLCLGMPDAAWADNQTQFRIDESLAEGEFKVYVDVAHGYVAVIQNGKSVDMLIRYHSRDEDSENFIKPTKADIIADGYDAGSVYLDDAGYAEFINKCVALESGSSSATNATPTTTDTTNTANTTNTTNTTPATTDTAPKTGDTVAVSAAILAVIAAATVVVAKKKANA